MNRKVGTIRRKLLRAPRVDDGLAETALLRACGLSGETKKGAPVNRDASVQGTSGGRIHVQGPPRRPTSSRALLRTRLLPIPCPEVTDSHHCRRLRASIPLDAAGAGFFAELEFFDLFFDKKPRACSAGQLRPSGILIPTLCRGTYRLENPVQPGRSRPRGSFRQLDPGRRLDERASRA